MDYVVKMDGEKVRSFSNWDYDKVCEWAKLHCRGRVNIVRLKDCDRLPKASKMRFAPKLEMPDLRYKPFVSLT